MFKKLFSTPTASELSREAQRDIQKGSRGELICSRKAVASCGTVALVLLNTRTRVVSPSRQRVTLLIHSRPGTRDHDSPEEVVTVLVPDLQLCETSCESVCESSDEVSEHVDPLSMAMC